MEVEFWRLFTALVMDNFEDVDPTHLAEEIDIHRGLDPVVAAETILMGTLVKCYKRKCPLQSLVLQTLSKHLQTQNLSGISIQL